MEPDPTSDPRVVDVRQSADPAPEAPAPRDADPAEPAPTIGQRLRALWCSFVSGLG